MVVNLNSIKSHPGRNLISISSEQGHTEGVVDNVKALTSSKWAELIALFHDLGKMNPNFQDELEGESSNYSHHAYFSAFAFYCVFCSVIENLNSLTRFVGNSNFSLNELIAAIVSIAKHHGNLPDFSPDNKSGGTNHILSKQEIYDLYKFLQNNLSILPVEEFVNNYFEIKPFKEKMVDENMQKKFLEQMNFCVKDNKYPLDFFQNVQFSFASLLLADKTDAAQYDSFIDSSKSKVDEFCNHFSVDLSDYLAKLNQETEINRLRTTIRETALVNIIDGLTKGQRLFELTSPTGSGKTLMLLSLALEIIKKEGKLWRKPRY